MTTPAILAVRGLGAEPIWAEDGRGGFRVNADVVLGVIREFEAAGGRWPSRLTASGIARALSTPQDPVTAREVLEALRLLHGTGRVVQRRPVSPRAAPLWREAQAGDRPLQVDFLAP